MLYLHVRSYLHLQYFQVISHDCYHVTLPNILWSFRRSHQDDLFEDYESDTSSECSSVRSSREPSSCKSNDSKPGQDQALPKIKKEVSTVWVQNLTVNKVRVSFEELPLCRLVTRILHLLLISWRQSDLVTVYSLFCDNDLLSRDLT